VIVKIPMTDKITPSITPEFNPKTINKIPNKSKTTDQSKTKCISPFFAYAFFDKKLF
jgi:hypothetical protein